MSIASRARNAKRPNPKGYRHRGYLYYRTVSGVSIPQHGNYTVINGQVRRKESL